jgi:hypothetical protein
MVYDMTKHHTASSRHSVSATTLAKHEGSAGDMTIQRAMNIEAGNREHARFDAEVRRHMQNGASSNLKHRRFMTLVTGAAVCILGVAFVTTML